MHRRAARRAAALLGAVVLLLTAAVALPQLAHAARGWGLPARLSSPPLQTGGLAIDRIGAGAWTDAATGLAFDPATDRLVAGQTLRWSTEVDLTAVGDNLEATLELAGGAAIPAVLSDHVQVTMAPVHVAGAPHDQTVPVTVSVTAGADLPDHDAGLDLTSGNRHGTLSVANRTIGLSNLTLRLTNGAGWTDTARLDLGEVMIWAPMVLVYDTSAPYPTAVFWLSGADATIHWGDGTSSPAVDGRNAHTFVGGGTYTVRIVGTFTTFSTQGDDDARALTHLRSWGDTGVTSAAWAFRNASRLQAVADLPPTVTNASGMFHGPSAAPQSIVYWNTAYVTNMAQMFQYNATFTRGINGWNTGRVTTMAQMFQGATVFNQDIGGWNTAQVTTLAYMFDGARAFDRDLSRWSTLAVTTMEGLFRDAQSFDGSLAGWITSNTRSMAQMFRGAYSFDQDVSHFDTRNVTTMAHMFRDARSLDTQLPPGATGAGWDTGNVTTMEHMFHGALRMNPDVSHFNTGNVRTMASMFEGATAMNQDLTAWTVRTGNVTDMSRMFYGASAMDADLRGWWVCNVTSYADFATGAPLVLAPVWGGGCGNTTVDVPDMALPGGGPSGTDVAGPQLVGDADLGSVDAGDAGADADADAADADAVDADDSHPDDSHLDDSHLDDSHLDEAPADPEPVAPDGVDVEQPPVALTRDEEADR